MLSTLSGSILRVQRDEQRPDARPAGAGIATPIWALHPWVVPLWSCREKPLRMFVSSSRNATDGRFPPRPEDYEHAK